MRTAEILHAIGEPTRMLILHALLRQPYTVKVLAEELQCEVVNVSHHLGVMRKAGLLVSQKQGRLVQYTINPSIHTVPSRSERTILAHLQCHRYRLSIRRPR